MSADDLTVGGRRFRTRADYEAALRDEKKIKSIKAKIDLNNPKQLYQLFGEMQSGAYRFESALFRLMLKFNDLSVKNRQSKQKLKN